VFSAFVMVLLLGATWQHWGSLSNQVGVLAVWVIVVAASDFVPIVTKPGLTLTTSMSVGLAAAAVLPPWMAAAAVFLGSCDIREFRGQTPLSRALYNRAQIGLTVFIASSLFHAMGVSVTEWPAVLEPFAAALMVDVVLNSLFVLAPGSVLVRRSPLRLIAETFEDSPPQFLIGYLAMGVLGVLIATVTAVGGLLGLVLSLLPLASCRWMLLQAQTLREAAAKIQRQNDSLRAASLSIADERREERLALAAELHDEVIPALFKVHLMAEVIKRDLETGQLLALEEDVPALGEAASYAQAATRGVVGGLRQSALGSDGLRGALSQVAARLESAGAPPIHIDVEAGVDGAPAASQLLCLHVAREALNNAARHARASAVSVRAVVEGSRIRVCVEDDGVGFAPELVDGTSHFGLQFIAERVEAAAGSLIVDSRLGRGTQVIGSVPLAIEA
jgi:signal transduction histidine kinase